MKKMMLSGTTLVELLVVMIVSGILFLLVFDGLNIVERYGRILNGKLSEKSGLLYSHQLLETLLERTDSVRKNEHELLLYNGGIPFEKMRVDSSRSLLYTESYTDPLFTGLVDLKLHPLSEESALIDSFYLSISIGRDTITLDYGLPFNNSYDTR
jgi:hypothetical protein